MRKIILCFSAVFVSTGLFAQESIAVFPFEDLDKVFTRNESVMFYREFSNEFTNKNAGKFKIVPRQEVEKLINTEAAFQLSDLSAKAKTAEMQKVLNGTHILSGVIGKVGSRISISVSLYSYPELQQLPGGTSLRFANIDELFDKIPEIVNNMQKAVIENKPPPTPPTEPANTYKIGDFGPAGGIVFYDKGVFSGGWRYLEAAPAETEFSAQWGAYKKDVVGTGTAIGNGKRNTQLIVEHLNRGRESGRAAQLCVSLNYDNVKDWFLPSKDELDLMYRNLKMKGLGGFGGKRYWSSSQSSNDGASKQDFYDGSQYGIGGLKNETFSVRAIRQF